MKKKFDFRKLFFLSYFYTIKRGREFNAFVLYVDILIWSVILSTVFSLIFISLK